MLVVVMMAAPWTAQHIARFSKTLHTGGGSDVSRKTREARRQARRLSTAAVPSAVACCHSRRVLPGAWWWGFVGWLVHASGGDAPITVAVAPHDIACVRLFCDA